MTDGIKKPYGRFVLMCFVAFFALIIVVNGIFIYMALNTHSGVVTEQPYKKGLAFNNTLEKAKTQPDLKHKASYIDGTLRWELPIENASVTASIIRPVQDGYDFDISLDYKGNGIYEVIPVMPLPGAWTAKLEVTWNNEKFQTSHKFIVP